MDVIRSNSRGYANIGWLKSYHTFSFGSYYNPKQQQCECIRVINEDYIKEGEIVPLHPNSEYDIFTYIISGSIVHEEPISKTPMIFTRGDVRFSSSKSKVAFKERVQEGRGELHVLQVWIKSSASSSSLNHSSPPLYSISHFSEFQKTNKLCAIFIPFNSKEKDVLGNAPTRMNQDVKVYASILEKNNKLEYFIPQNRRGYVHVINKVGVKLLVMNNLSDCIELSSGDGLFLHPSQHIIFEQKEDEPVEFLFFDTSFCDI